MKKLVLLIIFLFFSISCSKIILISKNKTLKTKLLYKNIKIINFYIDTTVWSFFGKYCLTGINYILLADEI